MGPDGHATRRWIGRITVMRSCLLLLLTTALFAATADVELSLTNGRTVRGELVVETDAAVTLRSRFPARGVAKLVESVYAKSDILKRKELPSPLQQYDERKARTPDTVPEQCTLAQWAYENCLREQAMAHATHVLELDPDSAWAKRILDNCGYIEVSGKWVDEVEYLKTNNLVRVDGVILPAGLAEARRTYARSKGAFDATKRKLDETREVASGKAASATTAEGKAKEAIVQVEAAKKAIEEAQKAHEELQNEPSGSTETERKAHKKSIDSAVKKLSEARDKQREAQRTADKAKQSGNSDKNAAERAKASISDLEAALVKAEAEMKAAATKLPADDPVLAKAAAEDKKADEKKAEEKDEEPAGDAPPAADKPKVRRLRAGGGE